MEQKLLHKMFNGEATDNELTQIRQWVNADKMNRETFYHERALFDALQLNAFQKGNHVRKQSVPLWKWIGSAAARLRWSPMRKLSALTSAASWPISPRE